ncbi:MAG: glycosyl transferase, group 1 [Frankiales bacterium]|nr:glycosyl transferase, group 1 [Frankiales bacterium]
MTLVPRLRRRTDALLVVIDVASAVLVSRVAYRLRFEGDAPLSLHYVHRYQVATLVAAVLWVLAGRWSGLYRRAALRPGSSNLESAFTASIGLGLVLLVLDAAGFSSDLSRAWIGLLVFGLLLVGIGTRGILRRCRRALVPLGVGLERYAVLGDDLPARRLVDDLTRAPGAPFRVVAGLSGDLTADEIVEQVFTLRLDGLILPPGRAALGAQLAPRFSGHGVDVLVAPQFGELEQRVASIAMLHGVPLLRVAGMSPRRGAERMPARDRTRHGVAILGTRGIPANYGGFETFAERLALQLVDRGVATTVYCRSHYVTEASPWRGVRLVALPTIKSKYFDTVVHTALSAMHLVVTRGPRDVVLCNAANAPVLLLLRLFGRRVVLNVDGLEWRRSKWGAAGRAWYRMGEWLSVRLASVLVTDAYEVQTYYRVRHDTDSVMIPYGADLLPRGSVAVPSAVPVCPDRYALYVSRWERENNPVMAARAHAVSGADLDLVMLGTATYDDELGSQVRAAAGPRAHLAGTVFGDGYRGLQCNALCYVHATEVGGTHPALIEAMGAGNIVLVLDTPENREVAADAGVFFADEEQLAERLRWVAGLAPDERDAWRARSRALAAERYSWDAVSDSYLTVLGGQGVAK